MKAAEDSDIVRQTFRRLCQRSALFLAAASLSYALVFLLFGIDQWYAHLAITAICLPSYWLMAVERSYAVFMTTLMLMGAAMFVACVHWTSIFGRVAGFQFVLMTILPVVVVSGRIGVYRKWSIVALFTVFLVGLDAYTAEANLTSPLTPQALAVVRAMNLTALVLVSTGLVFHYFRLAARQQAMLMDMAMLDPLTGLFNRRQMTARAQQAILECRRHDQPFSVVLCDLDHFKSINDTLGHDVGDAVLRRVSRELRLGVRAVDSVGRWGGEEFLLLLPQTDRQGAVVLANRLRQRVADPDQVREAAEPHVTATMGVAMFGPDDTLERVISRADAALYAGKAGGRNRVVVETP